MRSITACFSFCTLRRVAGIATFAAASLAFPGHAATIAPDNGSGTVSLPPVGIYATRAGDELRIVDGLPPGASIEIVSRLVSTGGSELAGGSLGGHDQTWSPASLELDMTGTGSFASFSRSIVVPGVYVKTYSAPRTPGTSPQSFEQDLFMLQAQLPVGDPDFDLLRITAGTGFGLPSPGHTTLSTAGAGSWSADSFFDVSWRIDFIGAPGSVFHHPFYGLLSGSTTGTSRFELGPVPEPSTTVLCMVGLTGLAAWGRRRA